MMTGIKVSVVWDLMKSSVKLGIAPARADPLCDWKQTWFLDLGSTCGFLKRLEYSGPQGSVGSLSTPACHVSAYRMDQVQVTK
jgi:hypothetical protein